MTDYAKLSACIATLTEKPPVICEKTPAISEGSSGMCIITAKDARSSISVEGCTSQKVKDSIISFNTLPIDAQNVIIDVALKSYNATREWADNLPDLSKIGDTEPETEVDEVLDTLLEKVDKQTRAALVHLIHKTTNIRVPKAHGIFIAQHKETFKNEVIIVPVMCENSHDYTLLEPIKWADKDIFYKFGKKKVKGNHMDTSRTSFRFPTFSEVVAFEWSMVMAHSKAL